MKRSRFFVALLTAIVCASLFAMPAYASTWTFTDGQTGSGQWVSDRFFFTQSTYVAGTNSQVLIDGKYYRFADSGYTLRSWYQKDGYWYYYDPASVPAGQAAVGWKQIDGVWYYFDYYGRMYSDTVTPDGYYVGKNGAWDGKSRTASRHDVCKIEQTSGWYQSGSRWFYLKNGYAVTGWKKVGGYWYYFDEDGVMQTDWQDIANGYDSKTAGCHTYFFNDGSYSGSPEGAMLKNCYVDGVHIDKYGISKE